MNYCDKIHYSLLTASPEDFPSMIDSLLSRLPEEERILRLVLFGTPVLKDEYPKKSQCRQTNKEGKTWGNTHKTWCWHWKAHTIHTLFPLYTGQTHGLPQRESCISPNAEDTAAMARAGGQAAVSLRSRILPHR